MIVLHALFTSNRKLFIWGEDSTRWAESAASRRARRRSSPVGHPFVADERVLRPTIQAIGQSGDSASLLPATLLVALPSFRGAPLASPYLLVGDEVAEAPGKIELVPWYVPGLVSTPIAALDLLSGSSGGLPAGIALGDSVRYWTEASRLVREWLARGQVIPTIAGVEGRHEARWRPLARGEEDRARWRLLVEAMPPLCRAEVLPHGKEPGAADLLEAFQGELADEWVRSYLASAKLAPPRRRARSTLEAATVHFLAALAGEDPTVSGAPEAVTVLTTQLGQWVQGVEATGPGALRTCFRLEAPDGGEGNGGGQGKEWALRFLLQANDDRSLLVPAEEVWKAGAGTLRFLRRTFEQPQERLLGDLGRALRLFPAIEGALRRPRPTGLSLTTEQAYDFLRRWAPLLEQAGFGLLVPPWWNKPTVRLGVRLRVGSSDTGSGAEGGLLGIGGLVDYSWELALGDEALTPEEFTRLSALKVPLVKVRGQWVELRPEEIEKAIAFFRSRQTAGQMAVAEALRLSSGAATDVGLPVVGVEAAGWIARLLDDADTAGKFERLRAPAGFLGRLRPYQLRGLSWLAFLGQHTLGACLADDMGLGKTIQLIALLLHERQGARVRPLPTLLVCPMSVVGNWQREVQRFAPSLDVLVHHGGGRLSAGDFLAEAKGKDLVITTYALVARDEETLASVAWGRVALDEAQNIKNSTTRQAQAVRRLGADQRVALTGTPVENRLTELWSIMEFLNPGYLGSAAEFRRQFAIPIERYRDEERAITLKRLVQPFVLRRLKTDRRIIKDLPDKIENRVYCNLTREQASLYQAVIDEMMARIEESEGIERKGVVLATMMKLKQVCNHPAHFLQDRSALAGRSGKLARLTEMLDEVVAEGDKALVFTQFAEMGGMLKGYLQDELGREVLFLYGATTRQARDTMVARFQGQDPPVFILSLKAGGTGLNLTAANHVFHFDRWWNPAVENQATDRAFRIGQSKRVQVHKYVCLGTLEERIDTMIEQKKALAESIIGTGESWLTELSTAELRELFVLGRDAVGEE